MQTNRFTAAVRKLLSIKGEERDIGFGVHLEDERPEYSFIKGEYLFSQWNETVSDVTHVARVGLMNPANSGLLAVVTACFAEVDVVGALIQFGWGPVGGLLVNGNVRMRDTRWDRTGTAASSSNLQYGSATNFATPGFSGIWTQLQVQAANAVMDFTAAGGRVGPIIITPGYGCWIAQTAVAVVNIRVTMVGYARSLESGELLGA